MPDKTARRPTTSFRIAFAEHPRLGQIEDYVLEDVGASDGLKGLDHESLLAALPEILRRARVKAAARFVDYDTFDNDSAYLDHCDKLAETFVPTGVHLLGHGDPQRYSVNGNYPNGEGGWSDWVYAATEEEANFQARWAMALNGANHPDADYLDDFVETMCDVDIDYLELEPVTTEELAAAARDLLGEIGPSTGSAYDTVAGMLEKLGIAVEPAPGATPR